MVSAKRRFGSLAVFHAGEGLPSAPGTVTLSLEALRSRAPAMRFRDQECAKNMYGLLAREAESGTVG
jgi:hypothetical protein